MGLRGPIAKSDDRRQRRNLRAPLVFGGVESPKPPTGLLKSTKERWATYWASAIAKTTQEAHLPIVERLFQLYDERDRAYRQIRKDGRMVEGSTGQPKLHPMLRQMDSWHKEIRVLEDRLGLSPKGMASLGVGFAQAHKSLENVNAEIEADEIDWEADPRIGAA